MINGTPDPDKTSTSYVERHNLSMRMTMRRFTRLTNHAAMVSLHFMHHNFARTHASLPNNTTPAMAAGISDDV